MRRRPGYVYWVGEGEDGPVKVGYSSDHPGSRVKELQVGNPHPLRVVGFIPGPQALEHDCHRHLAQWHIRGEWFLRGPALDLLIDLGRVENFDYDRDGWRLAA